MTKPSRKPNKRTIARIARETAEHLRELVAAFCKKRGGTETQPRQTTTDFGTFGASWGVPTRFGVWFVHEPSDPSTGLVSVNTRFENPAYVTAAINAGELGPYFALDFNHYSGKWNHHAEVMATNEPESFAASFLLDFEHRSEFLFPGETFAPSDAASCDERVAPSLLADSERTRGLGAPRDEVCGERRVAAARVAGDDQYGVLPEHCAQIGGEALSLGGERRAAAAVVLRPKDVEGQAGLALTEEDARRGRDGVAGEVAVRGRGNGRRRLLRVDGAPKGRAGKRAALPEADDDADRARGHGAAQGASTATSESHVLSVVQAQRVLKKWAAPDYVLIWFDKGDPSRVRLTVEHVDPLRGHSLVAAGWQERKGGRYTRVVERDDLATTLTAIGRMISRPTPI